MYRKDHVDITIFVDRMGNVQMASNNIITVVLRRERDRDVTNGVLGIDSYSADLEGEYGANSVQMPMPRSGDLQIVECTGFGACFD